MKTTLVGSYPKVAEGAYGTNVIGSISKWQRQELTDAQLEQVFQEITAAVLREQEQAGVDLLTDGQIRWEDLVTPIARGLSGFEINGLTRWFNNNVYYRRPILRSAPKWAKPILVEQYRFAAKTASRPVKAVLPGPYTFMKVSEDQHFKSERTFTLAMAEILNAEAKALAAAGAPVIQFDEPALTFTPVDIKLAVEALNLAVRGVKARTGVMTYFGSLNGGLAPLLRANVDAIGLDLVSDTNAISALTKVNTTKELILGCLDGRNTKLESVTELHALFDVIKKRVSLDRVSISPSCGLEFLPHQQALAKVQRLTQAVRTYKGA